MRAEAPGGAERFVILPELMAKEPLSPVVQRGDEAWFTLVKWVLFALITVACCIDPLPNLWYEDRFQTRWSPCPFPTCHPGHFRL